MASPKFKHSPGPSPQVMTLSELANYLRCHPSTIYRLLKGRGIPGFKLGSDWRFNVEAIDKWRAAQETGGK